MTPGVTICIPSIPPRATLLVRAVASVMRQTRPVAGVAVAVDLQREGAWTNRNRTIDMVGTEWTGFLDDDDELYPHHVATLLDLAAEHDADLVWGWFDVSGGHDPLTEFRGRVYTAADQFTVPITYLVRTELLRAGVEAVGGFHADEIGAWDDQDKPLFHYLATHGKVAVTERATWLWHHNQRNTSGLPARWQ